jgi:urease accessory protein
MNSMKPAQAIALSALCLFAGTASAHTGDHGTLTGFTGGLAHPIGGLDHLFAMVAIGLWAAQQCGRALWAIPVAFVGAMLTGGVLAWSGLALPQVETAIALSVLALGLLVAARLRASLTVGIAIAAGFALFHGYAHGLEMPLAASPALYAVGFVLATACLHGMGIAGSLLGRRAVQLVGAGIAATGLALMFAM